MRGDTTPIARMPRTTAWLVVQTGGQSGKIFALEAEPITIGREPPSQMQLDHPSVSSPHAVIRIVRGRYVLQDLASTNGTWVNANAVTGGILRDGASISIGVSQLFFTAIGSPAEEGRSHATHGLVVVRSGPSKGKSFPVREEDLVIGREPVMVAPNSMTPQ